MTLRGIRKDISIPFTFDNNMFKGEFEIDRTEYNIGPKGSFMVGKNIDVEIKCSLN